MPFVRIDLAPLSRGLGVPLAAYCRRVAADLAVEDLSGVVRRSEMLSESVIKVDPDSEIGDLLVRAEAAPLVLERNGIRFRLDRTAEAPGRRYDPARLREGLRRYAGTLDPEEGERWKEMIYRAREEGSRPADRPRDF